MVAYGITQHSAQYVASILQRLGQRYQFHVDFRKKPILLLTYSQFRAGLDTLNSKQRQNQIVFVFGSALRLSEFDNMQQLDNERAASFGFTLTRLGLREVAKAIKVIAPRKVSRPETEFLPRLINASVQGSFLSPFMTLIYALPSRQQTEVRKAILLAMAEGTTPKIDFAVKELTNSVLNLIRSEAGQKFATALHAAWVAKSKTAPFKSLAKKHGVDAYEIRYAVKLLRGTKRATETVEGHTLQEIYGARRRNARTTAASS